MEKINKKKIAEEILRLRFSQMLVNEKIKEGKFKIPIHLAMGHEAIAVAVAATMGKDDKLVLSHRNIAYHLARLGSLREIWDEYLLKPAGLNQGRSGSMNLANPKEGVIYTSSILGNNFPVGAGVAMAGKMLQKKGLTIVLGGDGSMEEGSFYESLILAKTLGLSILFIIENNDWSLATQIKERRCQIDLAALTKAIRVKYAQLSGNDPYKYITGLKKLRGYALARKMPICIEVKVATLGYWRGPVTPQSPKGKFINYHAGVAPDINFDQDPIIKQDASDPVFVVKKYLSVPVVARMRRTVAKNIN